jgi:hypothetical protein
MEDLPSFKKAITFLNSNDEHDCNICVDVLRMANTELAQDNHCALAARNQMGQ